MLPPLNERLVKLNISVDRPRCATPKEIAERVGLVAEQIQLELKKSHPDIKQIDKWLWSIRHSSIPLVAQFE